MMRDEHRQANRERASYTQGSARYFPRRAAVHSGETAGRVTQVGPRRGHASATRRAASATAGACEAMAKNRSSKVISETLVARRGRRSTPQACLSVCRESVNETHTTAALRDAGGRMIHWEENWRSWCPTARDRAGGRSSPRHRVPERMRCK